MTTRDAKNASGGKERPPSGERRRRAAGRSPRSDAPRRIAGPARSRARSLMAVCSLLIALALPGFPGQPRAASFQEYQLKAVFLYNFINFVAWPDEAFRAADRAFTIGVLGKDPFGSFLEKVVAAETFKGGPILLKRSGSLDDLTDCQILFIGESNRNRLDAILKSVSSRRVLTVGDFDGFIAAGGMINLVHAGQRVRIEINVQAVKNADLSVSSKLLRVAKVVSN